ncbi:MAG: TRAP transporter large permease subunit, partial [Desulfobulbaceae bacterium]|nr:TRAP transporter large permease subunit [Desulfobulbaceae bacterium]
MTSYILALILILLALLGTPLFAVIIGAAMLGFHAMEVDLSVIAIEIYRIADTPVLLALPLFTFAGYLLGESNTSKRLVRLTRVFLGWVPGGLAIVAFVACAFFTAFTGASGVTIVALGALLYPALLQAEYPEKFSLGLVTVSGSLGLLLPPSLPLILYGIIAQQMDIGVDFTISDLFIAGILPGLLMVVMLSFWSLWTNRKRPAPLTKFSIKEAGAALRESIWE